MQVSNQIVFSPTEAGYEQLKEYCRSDLTISNPEYEKRCRMNFWLGNTPRTLALYQVVNNDLVLPFGTLKDIVQICPMAKVESKFVESDTVDYECDVPLYDYQEIAVSKMLGSYYGILCSKAGSGKTQIGIAVISALRRKALWLCTTHDLLRQSRERAEAYMSKSLIGTITEGKVNIGKGITFATIQTMCKLDLTQYKDTWDVIIVDECHRVAGSPTSMTQFYKVLNGLSARHKYGLSATVHRADGMITATYALLGKVIYTVPDEAVADKIMKVGVLPVSTNTQESRCYLNTDGTLNYTSLINYLCSDMERCEVISDWLRYDKDRSCLVLSDRLEHLETLISLLPPKMREKAVMISGKMTSKKEKAEREKALDDMRSGRKKYLFATYALAKEGLDIPCLERLFLTTPQKDYAVITQSVGRVARICNGKSDPITYDFVDSIPYLFKCYKKRCTTYQKNGCYFIQEKEGNDDTARTR